MGVISLDGHKTSGLKSDRTYKKKFKIKLENIDFFLAEYIESMICDVIYRRGNIYIFFNPSLNNIIHIKQRELNQTKKS